MIPVQKGYLTTFLFYLVLAFSVLHVILKTFFFTKVMTVLAVFVLVNGTLLSAFNPKHTTVMEKLANPTHLISHAVPLVLILMIQWLVPIRQSFHFLGVWFACMVVVLTYYFVFIAVSYTHLTLPTIYSV